MTRPRRIAVVTGSRADYGHLRGVLTQLKAADDVDLSVDLGDPQQVANTVERWFHPRIDLGRGTGRHHIARSELGGSDDGDLPRRRERVDDLMQGEGGMVLRR